MLEITDPDNGAVEHIDGFVIPEVGDVDDWKKADEFVTLAENEHGLEAGSLSMSVIVESGEAELAMADLREKMGKPSNSCSSSSTARSTTLKGHAPDDPNGRTPALGPNSGTTSHAVRAPRGSSRSMAPTTISATSGGYVERMKDNRVKGMTGIWSLMPSQVEAAMSSTALTSYRDGWDVIFVEPSDAVMF